MKGAHIILHYCHHVDKFDKFDSKNLACMKNSPKTPQNFTEVHFPRNVQSLEILHRFKYSYTTTSKWLAISQHEHKIGPQLYNK